MKYLFALIIYFVHLLTAHTQSVYSFEYDYILNFSGIPLKRSCIYEFDANRSLFYHSRGKGWVFQDRYGNIGDETLTVVVKNENAGQVIDGYMQDSIGIVLFMDFKNRICKIRDIVVLTPYQYDEPEFELMKWRLSPDTLTLTTYLCHKATTEFRGRTYDAWYSEKLPADRGPWKFKGLPGTILKVNDRKGQISYTIKKISAKKNYTIPFQDVNRWFGKKLSFEEYKTIYLKERKRLYKITGSISDSQDAKRLNSNSFAEVFDVLLKEIQN